MKTQEHAGNAMLSRAAAYWFYCALVLGSFIHVILFTLGLHELLYEFNAGIFRPLLTVLVCLNGLAAAALVLKGKLYGTFWNIIPSVVLCFVLYGDLCQQVNVRQSEAIAFALFAGTPAVLFLSLIPYLRKLKRLGASRGPGVMAYTKSSSSQRIGSRAEVWWFRSACGFSFLFYLLMLIICAGILMANPPRSYSSYTEPYSCYMAVLAGAAGIYAITLVLFRKISGVFWSILPCFFLGLGTTDLNVGKPEKFANILLALAISATIMLLCQIPYLKKRHNIQWNGFKNAVKKGESFSEEDMDALYHAYLDVSGFIPTVFIPCVAIALLAGRMLSYGIGGAIGNGLAVVSIFAGLIIAGIIGRGRKKHYMECRDEFGLTDEQVRRAIRSNMQPSVPTENDEGILSHDGQHHH